MRLSVLVAVFNAISFCQSAKVVPVSSPDIQRILDAKKTLDTAQADWDALRKDIEHKYISDSHEEIGTGTTGTFITLRSNQFLRGDGSGTVYNDGSDAEESCKKVIREQFQPSDIQLCRKLLESRAKSKADQDAEAAKEKAQALKGPRTTVYSLKQGWEQGFDFSEDFHYLVPHVVPVPSSNYGIGGGFYIPR